MQDSISIVFMGTPDFAVGALKKMEHENILVKAVVTVADKPAGRGQKLRTSAVKEYALQKGYKILQPLKLKDADFLTELKNIHADLFVVVAFRMLPKEVWTLPPKGTINLHASLLPDYRGAAPINRAIMNGEKLTGATTFFINETIDSGAIIDRVEVSVSDVDTAGTLHDKLMIKGSELLQKTVLDIKDNQVSPLSQEGLTKQPLKEAPKIFKEDCVIDWCKDVDTVYNHIRGLNPYPGAFTQVNFEGEIKILKVFEVVKTKLKLLPGELKIENTQFFMGTDTQAIEIKTLQLEGKKRMDTAEFLRGLQGKTFESMKSK